MTLSSEQISVLLACHGMMASEVYSHALNRCSGFRVVARASTVGDAVKAVRANQIHLALVSSTLLDGPLSGIEALLQIKDTNREIKSVVLLESDESHLVTVAFRAGAKGVFLPEIDGLRSLCRCVRQVNAGQIWANSGQLQAVMEAFSHRAPVQFVNANDTAKLTKREEEVVQLVANGMTNRQIANELKISEHTVRNGLFRVFDKVGVSTRIELALYTINHVKAVPFERARVRKDAAVAGPQKLVARRPAECQDVPSRGADLRPGLAGQ